MHELSNLSITIRPCVLFSSTIIGQARVKIDNCFLLKEIPIFHCDDSYKVMLEREPVAVCPYELDINIVNDIVWSLRELIELAVIEEVKNLKSSAS